MCNDNFRIVGCEACGTEGYHDVYHNEECHWCEGTGGELIQVGPITLEDLELYCGN